MTASLSEVIRRKLLPSLSGADDSDVAENDDVGERIRRRLQKLGKNASRNFPKPPLGSNATNSNSSGTNDDSANEDIVKHYRTCIQLARDNKITARNAFSLNLIQDMKALLKEPQLNNFLSASFALDAGAKIYSFRVDCLHTETVRVSKSLGLKKNRNETENFEAEAEEKNRERPRRVTKGKNIVTNLDRINAKLDLRAEFDPILQKISAKFNVEGPTTAAFLTTLHHYKPDGGLLLSSQAPYLFKPVPHSPSFCSDNVDITDLHDLFKNINPGGRFCPTFNNFNFTSEGSGEKWPSTIFENFNETLDENFNIRPGASEEDALTTGQQVHENLDGDALQVTSAVDAFKPSTICSSSVFGSTRNIESKNPKEKKKRPKPKKAPFELQFDLETDVERFFTKKDNRISKAIIDSWMGKTTTFDYDDLNLVDTNRFQKLFLNSNISRHYNKSLYQNHGYEDDTPDVGHFSRNVAGDGVNQDGNSYHADSESDVSVGSQGDGEQGASGYSLIEKPFTVNLSELKIPYPRFAKSVNAKYLKNIMWIWISENAIGGKEVSFNELYLKLKNSVSAKTAKDLSEAIALNCLLSLANEKFLKIESTDNLKDCVISI